MNKIEIKEELELIHNREINLATGENRDTRHWRNKIMTLSEFVHKLGSPVRTPETLAEYGALPKTQQDEIKDVGGFVGGHLKNGRRGRDNVQNRHFITLDADFCEVNFVEICAEKLSDVCYTIYSTHKHKPSAPRLRLVIYPDRPLTCDEYPAVGRKITDKIGINQFDDTTYDVNRLMYWPSCPNDGEYVFVHNDAPFLAVDPILESYGAGNAWADIMLWPRSDRETARIKSSLKKQGNPLEKKGVVGAFCRVYNVHQAIDEFLQGVYKREKSDRYTYLAGSTSNGVVVYENGLFSYTHHQTDPAAYQLCNAFDLVRLHRFADLDTECAPTTPINRLPSYHAMSDLARDTDKVRVELIKSKVNFGHDVATADDFDDEQKAEIDVAWFEKLQHAATGEIKPTLYNAIWIIQNDPELSISCRLNQHSQMYEKGKTGRRWSDNDLTEIRNIIGERYSVDFSRDKVEAAIFLQGQKNGYHPVKEYLYSLPVWDEVPRCEFLFVNYFDAEDNIYTREVAKCWMIAAIQRVMEPGCKFDNVPVISGRQGIGKTQFIERLCPVHLWYGELQSFDPKLAQESMLGKWIMEINEMSATNKHDLEQQKSFLSGRFTTVRMAYARNPVDFLRQCVFVGTTNQTEYLKDSTGNRRWWPIEARRNVYSNDLVRTLEANRDQLWAEALACYNCGEGTELSREALKIAEGVQESKREVDEMTGLIVEYLAKPVSVERYSNGFEFENEQHPADIKPRDRVCILEIADDILGIKDRSQVKKLSRRIASILDNIPGWTRRGTLRFGERFGPQKAWVFAQEWDPPF